MTYGTISFLLASLLVVLKDWLVHAVMLWGNTAGCAVALALQMNLWLVLKTLEAKREARL